MSLVATTPRFYVWTEDRSDSSPVPDPVASLREALGAKRAVMWPELDGMRALANLCPDGATLVHGDLWLAAKEFSAHGKHLGTLRLPGLEGAAPIAQFGGQALRGLPVATNLPGQPGSFVHRDLLQKRLLDCLQRTRCVGLQGPAGSGKRRLAHRVAGTRLHNFPGGVVRVDGHRVARASDLASAVGRALSIRIGQSSRPLGAVGHALSQLPATLLILEEVDAVRDLIDVSVRAWLAAGPGVHIITTGHAPPSDYAETISVGEMTDHQAEALFHGARPDLADDPQIRDGVARLLRKVGKLPATVLNAADAAHPGALRAGDVVVPVSSAQRYSVESALKRLAPADVELLSQLRAFHGPFSLFAAQAVIRNLSITNSLDQRLQVLKDHALLRETMAPDGSTGLRLEPSVLAVIENTPDKSTQVRHAQWHLNQVNETIDPSLEELHRRRRFLPELEAIARGSAPAFRDEALLIVHALRQMDRPVEPHLTELDELIMRTNGREQSRVLACRAQVYFGMGRADLAVQDARIAMRFMPEMGDALALYLASAGSMDDALALSRSLSQSGPGVALVQSMAMERRGQVKEAIERLEKAHHATRIGRLARARLARVLLDDHSPDRAGEVIAELSEIEESIGSEWSWQCLRAMHGVASRDEEITAAAAERLHRSGWRRYALESLRQLAMLRAELGDEKGSRAALAEAMQMRRKVRDDDVVSRLNRTCQALMPDVSLSGDAPPSRGDWWKSADAANSPEDE